MSHAKKTPPEVQHTGLCGGCHAGNPKGDGYIRVYMRVIIGVMEKNMETTINYGILGRILGE